MKLFRRLLVAPAALGLIAPVANAADLNISGVSDYADSEEEQVTSITQFSDVYPTDWAYQALANLIERYGCVAGYPNGTYGGNRAMTRYEAAALLNACLEPVLCRSPASGKTGCSAPSILRRRKETWLRASPSPESRDRG